MTDIPNLGTPLEDCKIKKLMGENVTLRKITLTYQDDEGTSLDIKYEHETYIQDEEVRS